MLAPFFYLGMFELSYIGIGLISGPAMGRQKRSHFGARVSLTTVVLLIALLLVVTQNGPSQTVAIRIWIAFTVLALVTAPFVWYRSSGRFPGSSDSDGPGGSGPDRPLPPSPEPRGDLPLPDADQSLRRVRDHIRPALVERRPRRPARVERRPRRPAREPARTPVKPGRRP